MIAENLEIGPGSSQDFGFEPSNRDEEVANPQNSVAAIRTPSGIRVSVVDDSLQRHKRTVDMESILVLFGSACAIIVGGTIFAILLALVPKSKLDDGAILSASPSLAPSR